MKRIQTTLGTAAALLLLLSACVPAATSVPTQPPAATSTSASPTETTLDAPIATSAATEPASAAAPGEQTTFVIDPAQSKVSYSVDETFLGQDNRLATAVGVTSEISGQMTIDLSNPAAASSGQFTVDISTLATDNSRRDSAIRRQWLESSRYPTATFTITGISDFPADPQEGQAIPFKLTGDLTVRETTKPITWDVTATLADGQLSGNATTYIMMADWGVTPPDIAGMLVVKDGVTLTLDFAFQKQP
jgi:polyisoprenoid-binding protein YceI